MIERAQRAGELLEELRRVPEARATLSSDFRELIASYEQEIAELRSTEALATLIGRNASALSDVEPVLLTLVDLSARRVAALEVLARPRIFAAIVGLVGLVALASMGVDVVELVRVWRASP